MLPKLNKREKTCLGLLGAGAAALLLSSDSVGEESESLLFNPDVKSPLRRILAAPTEGIRGLNLVINGYDQSEEKILPEFYSGFKNVWDGIIEADTPVMWYVPKAGGNTIAKVLGKCLEMVTCSSMANTVEDGLLPDDQIRVHYNETVGSFVNVDPSTPAGIQKAIGYDLIGQGVADILITHLLRDVAPLFETKKGRLFAMLRHPTKRIADQFYYRQWATWEPSFDSELAAMSIDDYAASDRLIENFMVRSLVGKVSNDDVTSDDVALAKDILRRKFIIGIAEPTWFDRSVVRFEQYFGWWEDKGILLNKTTNYCHYQEIENGNHFGNHPRLLQGSGAYNMITSRYWADIELYMYAKNELFQEQQALV